MPSPPNITTITPPRVPFLDDRTGLISREWYRYFFNLLVNQDDNSASINGLKMVPAEDVAGQLAELAKQVDALTATAATVDQLAETTKQIDALASAPIRTPQLQRRPYGAFYDTTTQTAAAINTAYGITFNTTDLSAGVYLGSPTSRVYVDRTSVYNIQFSVQLDNTSGGDHLAYIWLRINGADVANSAGETRLKGNNSELIAAWNYVVQLTAGDYIELMWSVSDISLQLTTRAAAAPVPAVPSVIMTVTDNISAYQD